MRGIRAAVGLGFLIWTSCGPSGPQNWQALPTFLSHHLEQHNLRGQISMPGLVSLRCPVQEPPLPWGQMEGGRCQRQSAP